MQGKGFLQIVFNRNVIRYHIYSTKENQMSTYVNRNSLLIAIVIIAISSFLIPTLTNAFSLSLWAQCWVKDAKFSNKTTAEASVTYEHPVIWIIHQVFLIHNHQGQYSCHARVGANEPKKKENIPFWLTSQSGPVTNGHTETDIGNMRWPGDAYASSAISQYRNPKNWKFCSTDGQSSS